MIRINLLPVRASKKRELGKQWLVLFALIVIGVCIGNYMWWNDAETQHAQLRSKISKYKQDIQTLEKIIGEVKDIKNAKAEMQRKLTVLRELKAMRDGPVRVLDELATIIPQRVWLVGVQETKDGGLTLRGSGANHDEVATFMKKLKSSPLFGNPVLKAAKAKGENRVEFTITCSVKRRS